MPLPVSYLLLKPGASLPEITEATPSCFIVVVEAEVTPAWQSLVSEWIVRSGCLYMMAWGTNCSSWDDSVDMANIEEFKFDEIPEDRFVMTSWHSDEPLTEVLWFAKNNAFHAAVTLARTILLHISMQDREDELLEDYAAA